MHEVLAESDTLVDELLAADVIVAGVPMYNFGVPAQFKAYIDNIVRVGRTFRFDRSREGEPYWPMVPTGTFATSLPIVERRPAPRPSACTGSDHFVPSGIELPSQV